MDLLDDSIVPERARDVKQEAREFADEYIAPNAEAYYDSGEYPWEVLEAGMDAGLVAQDIGEEYGGKGFDLAQVLAIAEEFYRADAGIALTLQLASFGAEMVEQYGTDEQKEEYLRPVAENDQISGLAVSEPETGSDLAGMTTKAEKVEGGYELTGEKYWVGNAVEADWLTVYAKTGDGEDRYSNYTLFIVETDSDGYEAEHIPEKMGMRASKQGHIVFEDCFVPEENVVGSEGGGFYVLADFFNHGRVIACDTTPALLARLDNKTLVLTASERLSEVPQPLRAFEPEIDKRGRLVFRYRASESPVSDILEAVHAAGLTVVDVSTEETDLEDIFLQLTAGAHADTGGPSRDAALDR